MNTFSFEVPDNSKFSNEFARYLQTLNADPLLEPEANLLVGIQERLNQLDLEKRGTLGKLFKTSVSKSASRIVGLRTVDVFTFLQDYCNGFIPASREVDIQLMAGLHPGQSGIYMTPHYFADAFQRPEYQHLVGKKQQRILDAVDFNNSTYNSIAFFTAFYRTVLPHLPEMYIDETIANDRMYSKYISGEDTSDAIEELLSDLHRGANVALEQSKVFREAQLRRHSGDVFTDMIRALPEQFQQNAFNYLTGVAKNRSGLVIAFNENVFDADAEINTEAYDNYGNIHHGPEMVVYTDRIALDNPNKFPIEAIEPYGDFEIDLCDFLGVK